MPALINLTGKTVGRLTILERCESLRPKQVYWLCRCSCGTFKKIRSNCLLRKTTNSCGCLRDERAASRVGPASSRWKGGLPNKRGYLESGEGLQHRRIMEKVMGRKLYPEETVHHINGIRSDNRLENLELWASNHPPGQRVSDLVEWAKEILKKYGT